MRFGFWGCLASVLTFGTSIQACSSETPCDVGGRSYYIAMPENVDRPVPAVVYVHGWGGSGKGALRNSGMVSGFLARGVAVVAPDGVVREGRNGRSWRFHPDSGAQLDDISFLVAVRDDAEGRFDLDPNRMILAGFSIGGSMTAYSACLKPEAFAAYAPLGGNFWRPHPTECAGPVRLLHTHGWTDGTVPLEGRVVNGRPADDPDALVQGDIFHAMSVWRETNQCDNLKADRFDTDGPYWRRIWDRCSPDSALELALFPGGHSIPRSWPDLVVDWFEGL
ncbi:hypothetical protein NBRC116594_15240 [Shimia sp. NS0008-38b]|uniref:alpha/beta hydrolase family esterase n=1 Tax=Shimia sp. NS0008-38b TaxID=3127653 RepID=UPI0031053483